MQRRWIEDEVSGKQRLRHPLPTVFLAALLATSLAAFAQTNRLSLADEYTVRRWGVEDGLPEGAIQFIEQAPDGFIWCVTPHNVLRFDGVSIVSGVNRRTKRLLFLYGQLQVLPGERGLWVFRAKGSRANFQGFLE